MEVSEHSERDTAAFNLERLQQLGKTELLFQYKEGETHDQWKERCAPLYEERKRLIEELRVYLTSNPRVVVDGQAMEIYIDQESDVKSLIHSDGGDGFFCYIKTESGSVTGHLIFTDPKFQLG